MKKEPLENFTVDKQSPVPYYYQIEEWLRGLIASGHLRSGDMIANEISLSEQLGVSRMTVRQALDHLTREGLLIRQRAIGTFVAPPRRQFAFIRDRLNSLTEEIAAEGQVLRSQVLAQELLPASGEVQSELGLQASEPVISIRRLRLVEGEPLVIENAFHPYARFPDLLTADMTDRSIYDFLEQKYGARPVEAVDTLIAGLATQEEADLLQIEPGAPVMRCKRAGRDANGRPMELTLAVFRPDRYQFVIRYRSPEE